MNNKQDHFALWVLSGIIGIIIRDIWSIFAREIGLAQFFIWNLGASLMVETAQIEAFWGHVAGFLVDIVIGGTFGVIVGLFLEWRGRSSYFLKGWGLGVMTWLLFYGIMFHNLPISKANAPGDPASNISAFIGHSITGIATVLVYVKLLAKKFNSETITETEGVKSSNNSSVRYKLISQPLEKTERKVRVIKPIKIK